MLEVSDCQVLKYINENYFQYYVSYFLGKEKKLMDIGEDDALKIKQFSDQNRINFKKDN